MYSNKLIRLLNRAQKDLDAARKEIEEDTNNNSDEQVSEEIKEVRLRLDALEVRVSAIEEGH